MPPGRGCIMPFKFQVGLPQIAVHQGQTVLVTHPDGQIGQLSDKGLEPAQTGRRITYGELAADAARMPVPETVALKRPEEFGLIGTPARRLDTPAKVDGTA